MIGVFWCLWIMIVFVLEGYTGGERDKPEGSRIVEKLYHLVDGNNGRRLPDGRKGMQSPGEIEDVKKKKKIYARARKVL